MSSSSKKIDDFKIPLKEIVEATNNFENLIGEGGFGKVYKGILLWTGKRIDIAARRLHCDYGQGDLEFWNEISMLALSGLKHDNLVSFVGYCDEDGQKIVVTKYEAKQSLDVHLKDSNLSWTQRLQICVGIAHALSYIHYDQGHDLSVIHRNIKCSKVLLDNNWKPKLSGFGISLRNSKARRHRYLLAEVIGTIGYVDPTYEKTGFVTHKSDVFSFGVLLFEVLCGRRAFRLDEQEHEQHSPQLFKYDNKEGKLADVVVRLDGIPDPHLYNNEKLIKSINILLPDDGGYRQSASLVGGQAPAFSWDVGWGDSGGCDDGYRKSASFIGREPSSFSCGAEKGNSSSNISTTNQPVSITQNKLGDEQLPSVDRRANNSNIDIPMKSFADMPVSVGPLARADPRDGTRGCHGILRRSFNFCKKSRFFLNAPCPKKLCSSFCIIFRKCTWSNCVLGPSRDQVDSPSTVTAPSPAKVPTPSPVNLETASPANEPTAAASPALETTPSPVNLETASPANEPTAAASPALETTPSPVNLETASPANEPTAAASPALETTPSPVNLETASPANEPTAAASPALVTTTSAVNLPTTSPANEPTAAASPAMVTTTSPVNDQLPIQYDSSTKQDFTLHPLYTMKKLERYIHNPNEELLAQLVTYHYDDLVNNLDLDDMIDQALKEQMDPESFKIFSETAFSCLKEQRSQRPNIDLILNNLKIALAHQMKRENLAQSHIPGEVEGTSSSSKRLEGGHLDHLKIPLSEIEMATKKFTQKYLGSGAYGKVYRADLQLTLEENDQGEFAKKRTVAIKCIRDDKHGKEGFVAEIELLTSCKHPNVVCLLGFCNEGPNMILVYEHAPNKSLDDYLGSTNNPNYLTWAQRIKIGLDIARGLHYLHTKVEDEQRIIHRDIKSGNILLGKNWAAKIADFGLSRFHHVNQQGETLYTGTIAGTKVYLCPEYMNTGRLKRAVDIYSLGVVLFEILSGKLANDRIFIAENEFGIAHVARRRFQEGTINEMVDPKIMEEVDELTSTLNKGPNQDSLQTFIEIAHQCIAETQDKRPTANDIVDKLEVARVLQEINKDNFQMSFEEIEVATEKFSRRKLIGGGGFGLVYKGQIGGNVIAVKRLDKKQLHDRQAQGELHFLTELEILFEYKHKNIISLEGYCNWKDEKIIVYEYAPEGSLDRHLKKNSLTWIQRLQICIDVACGLAYLHHGAQTNEMVIHRDIKCANILLTGDWKAKISDFGLSSITATNQEDISHLVGTNGYLDPEYESTGFFTEKSDIYSFGVVLFEILYGKLVAPDTKNYDQKRVDNILKDIHKKENLDYVMFLDIKRQIAPESLSTFQKIVSQCLQSDRESRPTAEYVLQQLTTALELQEEYEIWQPKLPKDYKEIIQMSKYPGIYSTKNNKDLYNIFSNGILLPNDKVWFSLGNNGERNEMISARKFSYKKGLLHKWRSIGESRFQKVAKMLNISNLDIQIQIKTRFLSPDVTYGVYLVFKFSDLNTISISKPLYVNLRYKMESENLQAYFATSRDDKWMMIELCRFLNHKENNDFSFILESLSRYHCRSDAIYVEGIEFRAIHKVKNKDNDKLKQVQNSPNANLNMEQLVTDYHDIIKRSSQFDRRSGKRGLVYRLKYFPLPIDNNQKLFSISNVNGKKCHMLPAKAVLHKFSNIKLFALEDSVDSSYVFNKVVKLLSRHVFRIKCKIESVLLSSDTNYACYLVFKLSDECGGLNYPVKVRDQLRGKNKEIEIIYFRSPSPINLHDTFRVSEKGKDGWMEVNVWEFKTDKELKDSDVPMDLILTSYQGTMRGLILNGIEFRPM